DRPRDRARRHLVAPCRRRGLQHRSARVRASTPESRAGHVRLPRGLPCARDRRGGVSVLDGRLLRAAARMTAHGSMWYRLRVGAGIAFSIVIVGACFVTARRLTTTAWPLQEANVALVLTASAAYLASFFLRALGWQRLFPGDRPDRSRCLAACGAAAASGVVLPFRLDYAVKIWTLRRLGGVRLGLDTVG